MSENDRQETNSGSVAELFHLVGSLIPEGQRVITAPPDMKVADAIRIMSKNNFAQLPVVAGGLVLGVFSLRSFASGLLKMGESIDLPSPTFPSSGSGSLLLGSPRTGRLGRIASLDELRRQVPQVRALHLAVSPGDTVERFEHGGHTFGYVLFGCEPGEDFLARCDEITSALDFEIEMTTRG